MQFLTLLTFLLTYFFIEFTTESIFFLSLSSFLTVIFFFISFFKLNPPHILPNGAEMTVVRHVIEQRDLPGSADNIPKPILRDPHLTVGRVNSKGAARQQVWQHCQHRLKRVMLASHHHRFNSFLQSLATHPCVFFFAPRKSLSINQESALITNLIKLVHQ